jgi:hypothetical protein
MEQEGNARLFNGTYVNKLKRGYGSVGLVA